MAPTRLLASNLSGGHSSRLIYALYSLCSHGVAYYSKSNIYKRDDCSCKKEGFNPHEPKYIVFAVLIPVLVLLSGLFAGLTLGYMSLDQTQLNVLSISGTPEQRKYANQIKPIRKNGHLLLVTLLLANMIVNESLPVIADPVLGGGVQSVAVSTVLIVIFAEIIPQSLFTRYGLYLGAKGAGFTRFLIYTLGIISWPVAKLLDWVLGSNHGIIYRRVELKELIAMHASTSPHGGDLKHDTVTIIGATLDLQEKVVSQAMTPIKDVFMLSIDSKLDYETLAQIVATGHSRVPVYEEVGASADKVKRIVGIFLVKQCVLLDPKDATPLRTLQLNRVPFVPQNESLLGILDKFQEGRSHMAIVSRFSAEKAKSVKKAVTGKRGLTRRFLDKVGMGDTSSEEEEEEERRGRSTPGEDTLRGDDIPKKDGVHEKALGGRKRRSHKVESQPDTLASFEMSTKEQSMPADAVLAPKGAEEFLQKLDPAMMPLGIITLEDVLEEIIGEEIYDEFDVEGAHGEPYIHQSPAIELAHPIPVAATKTLASVKGFGFLRSSSAPPRERPPPNPTPTPRVEVGRAIGANREDGTVGEEKNPALGAILLDRRRRLVREGTASSVGMKGKFKSEPIDARTLATSHANEAGGGELNPHGGDTDTE